MFEKEESQSETEGGVDSEWTEGREAGRWEGGGVGEWESGKEKEEEKMAIWRQHTVGVRDGDCGEELWGGIKRRGHYLY